MRLYNGGRNRHGKVWYKKYGQAVLEGMIEDGVDPLNAHHIAQWEELYGPSEERIAKAQSIYDQWYNELKDQEPSCKHTLEDSKKCVNSTHNIVEEDGIPQEASKVAVIRAVRVIEEGRRFQRFREAMKESSCTKTGTAPS